MPSESTGKESLGDILRSLIGLEVSLPWKGYGTAIFLELGALTPASNHRRDGSLGEACIGIEWDWRVESETAVAYGSSDSRRKIADGIATLQGTRVTSVQIMKGIPDLRVTFSNGQRLRTMVMRGDDPQWRIRLPDQQWLWAEDGEVHLGPGEAEGLSEEEEEVAAAAAVTATRWGSPRLEPAPGNCRDCRSFVHLDGHFALLDYGCCTAPDGPFEGRAVNASSGCPKFQPWQTGND